MFFVIQPRCFKNNYFYEKEKAIFPCWYIRSDIKCLNTLNNVSLCLGWGRSGFPEQTHPARWGGVGPSSGETGNRSTETRRSWEGSWWEWKVNSYSELGICLCMSRIIGQEEYSTTSQRDYCVNCVKLLSRDYSKLEQLTDFHSILVVKHIYIYIYIYIYIFI